VDANQAGIVADLRLIPGCQVLTLAEVGSGCPDLLVGYRGFNFLFELKNPDVHYNQKLPTIARQKEFRDKWPGQVRQVTTFTEILNAMTGVE
jgi:hypothetical protein